MHEIQKSMRNSPLSSAENDLQKQLPPQPYDEVNACLNVLVVEDDFSVRETLGMVLEAYNYRPILIESGEKAIDYLRHDWPDVMLLDLTLGDANGEDIHRQIKNCFGRVPPTIVLSAVQHGEVRAHRLEGASFLAKPYSIEDLVEMIKAASSSRAA